MCIDLVAQRYVADVEDYAKRHQNLADGQALESGGPRRQFLAFMPKPKDQGPPIIHLHGSEQDKRQARHRCVRFPENARGVFSLVVGARLSWGESVSAGVWRVPRGVVLVDAPGSLRLCLCA